MFGSSKVLRKKRNVKQNSFLMFCLVMKNIKKSNIIKINKNLCILKLFNLDIIKKNKWNEFEEAFKNNLLTSNLFFFHFFFPFSFPLYFLFYFYFLHFPLNFSVTKHSLRVLSLEIVKELGLFLNKILKWRWFFSTFTYNH